MIIENTYTVITILVGIILLLVIDRKWNILSRFGKKRKKYRIEKISDNDSEKKIKELLQWVHDLQEVIKKNNEEKKELYEKIRYYEKEVNNNSKKFYLEEEHQSNLTKATIIVDEVEKENLNLTPDPRIYVSYSFSDPTGTLKLDDKGDMYLIKGTEGSYELNAEKEILGTAIYLEIIQYSYKILNPKNANDKPMEIVKKPKYNFNNELSKGFLVEKGEVAYK